jgi:uncharacterized protein
MLETLGFAAAVLMGATLGLLGGGGSILTVPILVYLFGVRATDATAYSLLIVGSTAALATWGHARSGNVRLPVALAFGVPSVLGVFAMRRWLVPMVPQEMGTFAGLEWTKDRLILILFGLLMLVASMAMVRPRPLEPEASEGGIRIWRLGGQGLATGLVTGSVGAGGGFLIVPSLVILAGMPMKTAVGTSLFVIALNSLLGVLGDIQVGRPIDWALIGSIILLAAIGAGLGTLLARRVSSAKLKPAFGYFVLVMGVFVILGEVLGWSPQR